VVPFYKHQVLQELGARAIRRPLRECTIRQTVKPVEANSHRMTVRLRTQVELLTRWPMCRNIKTLFNFDPPATELEIRDASLQFVRKLSGFNVPSKANQAAFDRAVEDVAAAARLLIGSLVTAAEPRNRDVEAAKAKALAAVRFGAAGRGQ
jgi:hypothetical protein